MKLISVIVPVYKAERYLGECVDSILNQTYESFELILVDDGSPDNSGKICDEYAKKDERVKVIHKENGGVSSARNTGIDNAAGEYIAFVDSDDTVDKQYLELMCNKLEETNSDLCFCHFNIFDENSCKEYIEQIPKYQIVDFEDEEFICFSKRFFGLKNNVMGSPWRTLIRRSCVGDIRFNPQIKICEDLVFIVNVVFNSESICSIPNALYQYRVNSNSAGRTYKKSFLTSQLEFKRELYNIFNCFDEETIKKVLNPYLCLQCYYLFSNEIKYKKMNFEYKKEIRRVKQSDLYKYFKFKYVLKIRKFKVLAIWLLIKLHLY